MRAFDIVVATVQRAAERGTSSRAAGSCRWSLKCAPIALPLGVDATANALAAQIKGAIYQSVLNNSFADRKLQQETLDSGGSMDDPG